MCHININLNALLVVMTVVLVSVLYSFARWHQRKTQIPPPVWIYLCSLWLHSDVGILFWLPVFSVHRSIHSEQRKKKSFPGNFLLISCCRCRSSRCFVGLSLLYDHITASNAKQFSWYYHWSFNESYKSGGKCDLYKCVWLKMKHSILQ